MSLKRQISSSWETESWIPSVDEWVKQGLCHKQIAFGDPSYTSTWNKDLLSLSVALNAI